MQNNALEQALKVASQTHNLVGLAAIALVVGLFAFIWAVRSKKRISQWIFGILATGFIVLAVSALASYTLLKWRGMYVVRVVVLGLDTNPVEDADVTSSSGDQPKKFQGGWEFDIPPQTRTADSKVVIRASVKNAFLTGSSSVVLGESYYLETVIQLTSERSAIVRGVVEDGKLRPVAGASVSVNGYSESVLTDKMGNFSLPAHVADGQIVQIRAEKGELSARLSVPAGSQSTEVILKHP